MAKQEAKDLIVAWRVGMRSDGRFYAERLVLDARGIVSRDQRESGGPAPSSEVARRDMERITRELWDKAWSRDRLAEYETVGADGLALMQQQLADDHQAEKYETQLVEWDARIASREADAATLKPAAELVGKLAGPTGALVDEAKVRPEQRFLYTPPVSREAAQAQVASMREVKALLLGEYERWQSEGGGATARLDTDISTALERATALRAEGRTVATEVALSVKGRPWS